MQKKIRCKVCGYVTAEGNFSECPACGAPLKAFEDFNDPVSEKRRSWLDKDAHPVIVHAPQATGIYLLLMTAVYFITFQFIGSGKLTSMLLPAIQILSILLPLTVLAAIAAGLADGKVRFKKLGTILLKKKIFAGSAFFILSLAMAVIAFLPDFKSSGGVEIIYLVLNLGAFLCSMILGLWGASLVKAVMPGAMPKK